MSQIILASQSPRRKQLMEWAEVNFQIIVANTDETFPKNLDPEQAAIHIAMEKAKAVQQKAGGKTIVAADTMVVLNREIIGKPADRDEAINILNKLSGHRHKVVTGVVIMQNEQTISFSDSTDVEFHVLSQRQIEFYIDNYKPYDKAGAYAIQEWIGVVGIKSINGDFYNVMGLPISRVVRELQKFT
jgi:septum formation protein